jgi:nucleotide-binding universal stress UspA family protein
MFEKVVIAADSSKDSNILISSLSGLKAYGTKNCLLVQFRTVDEIVDIAKAYNEAVLTEYVKNLQKQKSILEKLGFNVETRILTGFSPNEINRIALEEDYSAIVVGAQKHSFAEDEIVFSDLANDLIHNARKPVLLIRLDEEAIKGSMQHAENISCKVSNHILFPTDFSTNADLAFTYVTEMAADAAKKITLLHVQDKTRISPYLDSRIEEFNEIDTARLQSMKNILMQKGNASVEIVIKYGSPAVEILNIVKENDVELVVMGTQGRGYVNEFFLGSVSHNIARNSPSSVLLIPTVKR